jgi:hypothetical protein
LPIDIVGEAEGFNYNHTVFPDNWTIVKIFKDMLTQWRYGPGGAAGLDYNALNFVMSIHRVKAASRKDVFDGVVVMEKAALVKIKGSRC